MGVRATKEWLDEQLKRGHRIVSNPAPVSHADVEPVVSVPSVDAKADTGLDTSGRPVVLRITGYRHRLCDADGQSIKGTVDGIVHAGILPNDSPEFVQEVRTAQVKIASDQPEYTVVEICKAEG